MEKSQIAQIVRFLGVSLIVDGLLAALYFVGIRSPDEDCASGQVLVTGICYRAWIYGFIIAGSGLVLFALSFLATMPEKPRENRPQFRHWGVPLWGLIHSIGVLVSIATIETLGRNRGYDYLWSISNVAYVKVTTILLIALAITLVMTLSSGYVAYAWHKATTEELQDEDSSEDE